MKKFILCMLVFSCSANAFCWNNRDAITPAQAQNIVNKVCQQIEGHPERFTIYEHYRYQFVKANIAATLHLVMGFSSQTKIHKPIFETWVSTLVALAEEKGLSTLQIIKPEYTKVDKSTVYSIAPDFSQKTFEASTLYTQRCLPKLQELAQSDNGDESYAEDESALSSISEVTGPRPEHESEQ